MCDSGHLSECVGSASKEACDAVFREVASFAREALTERNRRLLRDQPGRVVLLHVPVTDRIREEDKRPQLCHACSKHSDFSHEQLCDRCKAGSVVLRRLLA